MKGLVKKYGYVVGGIVGLVLFFEHYEETKKLAAGVPLLNDLMGSLPVIATIITGFGVLWFQRKQEAEERAKRTLLATAYRLGAQYGAVVSVFCLAVEKWLGDRSVTFGKFPIMGDRHRMDISELAAIDGQSKVLTELISVEDGLSSMRVNMEGINQLIDMANVAAPARKVQVRNEIIAAVKECLVIVIDRSKEFKDVAVRFNSELKERGKNVEIDTKSIEELIGKAEGLRMVFERVQIDQSPSSVRAVLMLREDEIVYKHINGVQQSCNVLQLLAGGVDQLVQITSEEYGIEVGEELRLVLLSWLADQQRKLYIELQKEATRVEQERKKSAPDFDEAS
ncbi:hypothetical protein [Halodesulfovibrio spirochaetisodalis]|uniref:Uncharacterized protein n=1 Tax=Halodesulfovibrio spirochaetisodalis TaxID=1560234 RepID=A0A1B7X9L8_9BACT|nr:hypothetical protein [Halodesulfovibrio spirochaetisodalis]OBQ46073.1 hypothetical protein SP90_14340 [Halodesulfovibrio spirochaetisodalis]